MLRVVGLGAAGHRAGCAGALLAQPLGHLLLLACGVPRGKG